MNNIIEKVKAIFKNIILYIVIKNAKNASYNSKYILLPACEAIDLSCIVKYSLSKLLIIKLKEKVRYFLPAKLNVESV